WKWAIEGKGLEQSCVDTRVAKGYALAFAVNPRGADHLHTETFAELGLSEEGKELIKKITDSDKFIDFTSNEKRAEIVRWHEDCYAASDALGFCAFTTTALYGLTPKMMAEMWSAAIGEEVSEEELMKAGRRMVTLEKAFNVLCGATRSDDRLPWRIMNEGVKDRVGEDSMVTSQEELDKMLDEYYTLHSWDLKTSWPTRTVLKNLDLDFVIEEFEKRQKLLPI
ncbi:MAG: aldehyde ferredoxin oxidoreductase C-terminal domain-containing protein, partial [Atribacterota bacterium]